MTAATIALALVALAVSTWALWQCRRNALEAERRLAEMIEARRQHDD